MYGKRLPQRVAATFLALACVAGFMAATPQATVYYVDADSPNDGPGMDSPRDSALVRAVSRSATVNMPDPEAVFVSEVAATSGPGPFARVGGRDAPAGAMRRSLGGPEGAEIRNIVPDPLDSQTIYLGTFVGGIHKSADGGDSWEAISNGLPQIDFRALAVHPSNTSILLAAGFAGGPLRSEDGGASWSWSNTGTTASTGLEFVFDSVDPSRVYFGSAGQMYVSNDTGVNWTEIVVPGTSAKNAIVIDPTDRDHLFVGTNTGLFHSTDAGATWSQITSGFGAVTNPDVRAIIFDSQNASLVCLAFFSRSTGDIGGIYRSTDGGMSWTAANAGIPSYVNFDHDSLAADPFNEGHMYVAVKSNGVYKTTDGGLTWSLASSGFPAGARQMWAVATGLPAGEVYAGNAVPGGGFYVSTNGAATWSRASNGLYAEYGNALEAEPADPQRFYFGTRGGILRRQDTTWERVCTDLPSTNTANRVYQDLFPAQSTIYASHGLLLHSGVFVSLDDGASCTARPNGSYWTNGIGADPTDANHVFVTTGDGVFESLDAGQNWTARNVGLTTLACSTIRFAPDDPLRLYVGTDGGGVFRSTDGGLSWSAANTGLPNGGSISIVDIDIDPTDSTRIYAVTNVNGDDNVYRSVNAGDTWEALSAWPSPPETWEYIRELDVAASDPDLLVAIHPYSTPLSTLMMTTHVMISRDGGDTWDLLADDLFYTSAAVLPTDPPTVIAAAVGQGVLQLYGPTCFCGDIDGSSGIVDLNDFATFALCFGLSIPNPPDCDEQDLACSDLDGNGVVELADFATFALWFGLETTQTVPNCQQ
jgi:photosystem II stability/assembly factor-like uncharacterized protein